MPVAALPVPQPASSAPARPGAVAGSHEVTDLGDRVIVHGLEVFMAFDPAVDDPDDERVASLTESRIDEILETTSRYIALGTNPRLIRGHNSSDPEAYPDSPAVGLLRNLRKGRSETGVALILSDVEMPRDVYDADVVTNRFPRRSAEIWPDGFLSEVALLGSRTPARPLRDTHFGRADVEVVDPSPIRNAQPVLRFSRTGPALTFHQEPDMPGKKTDTETPSAEQFAGMEEEMQKLKAENDELKEQLRKYEDGEHSDDEAEKNARDLRDRAARFERENVELVGRVSELEDRLNKSEEKTLRESYDRRLSEMASAGYLIPEDQRSGLLDDFCGEGGAARFDRFRATCARGAVVGDPLPSTGFQSTAIAPPSGGGDMEERRKVAKHARDEWTKYAWERQKAGLPVEKTVRDFLKKPDSDAA